MEVHQVENNAEGEVAEGDVVELESLASVDHLDPIELRLVHSLKRWDLDVDTLKVQKCGFVGIHAIELRVVSPVPS